VQHAPRQSRSPALQAAVTIFAVVLLGAVYIGAMRAVLGVSKADTPSQANHRDLVYVYLHVAILAVSAALGFAAGKWLSGLGFAFATLFVICVVVFVVSVQLSSYELACHGHNDLVRHWQC
jgi:hypothetical protein